MSHLRKIFVDQEGTTSVEYAIMMALILMACILGITSFGNGGANLWVTILTELNNFLG